jgi:hypothetical protein
MNDDKYGSLLRESMKRSMEYPAGYWGRKASFCERHDITWPQRIIGSMALVCIVIEIVYQIGRHLENIIRAH